MKTLQIENIEIESFIDNRYGNDIQSLWQDFSSFVKVSLSDDYASISKKEAKLRVAKAIEEVELGNADMLSQEEYDKEMNTFMKVL